MNLTRLNKLAKRLPKKRGSRKRPDEPRIAPDAIVDEYNNRQIMPCKETRRRWQPREHAAGPVAGLRRATTISMVEKAQRTLPPIELAA